AGCGVNALSGLEKKCRKSLKTAPDTKTVFKGSLADAENTTSPQQVNPGTHITVRGSIHGEVSIKKMLKGSRCRTAL
ncbi:hypothetical protein, partial [Escherichia sp. TW09231]|uniref:hypothetical protein n=1 Tax=Escherichia sp. TW09231 TaxID=754327 RepID=UPI0006ACFB19